MSVPTGSIHKRILKQMLLKWKIHEFFKRELPPIAGYVSVDLIPTSLGHQIIIYAKNPGIIVGRGGRRSRELAERLKTELNVQNPKIEVKAIKNPELNAQLIAKEIARAIGRGMPIRRVAYSFMHRVMSHGALGVEIRIGGKLQKRRSRRYRFAMGTLIYSGEPADKFVDVGKASILVKTGVIGVRVTIVKPIAELPDKIEVKGFEEIGGDIEKFKREAEEEAKRIIESVELAEEVKESEESAA